MNNKKVKNVKKEASPFNPNELYNSALDIPNDLRSELDSNNLHGKWINAIEFKRNFGFNRSGWTPYKAEKLSKAASADSLYGGDPEGYVRRGDLVLAVKTKEEAAKQKRHLKQKAGLYKNFNKLKAEEMKQSAREAGVDAKVFEGYDENDAD